MSTIPPARSGIARAHTLQLYEQATRLQIGEGDFGLVLHLRHHLPGDLPEEVERQLIAVGIDLFAAENLGTEIPKPPAICNSLEGARYRDMLARIGRVRGDANMARSAAHIISESLAEIARYAARTDGELYVPITANIPISRRPSRG